MIEQPDLFGTPPKDPEQSQLFTPDPVARLMAEWVPPTARVIEPCGGGGNLIAPLIRRGHAPGRITVVERDPRWHAWLQEHYPDLGGLILGDFFKQSFPTNYFDVALMNPPYEENQHTQFVIRALQFAPVVIVLIPISFEYTKERDKTLWAPLGKVTRRAKLVARLDHGGPGKSGTFDSCALKIERRLCPRQPRELSAVLEETWVMEEAAL